MRVQCQFAGRTSPCQLRVTHLTLVNLNLWITIPNCFWLLLLLLPPIYHCLWADMLSNYLSALSSTTSTVLDSVDTGAWGCGIAERYGHWVLLRETHHSHAHCTHTQQDLTDLTVMIARPVTSETITIGHLEPLPTHRPRLHFTHPASFLPSTSVAPQILQASRFASSPSVDVLRTCNFAGRCHKSVPLSTCQPTSRMLRTTPRLGPHIAGFMVVVGELDPLSYVPHVHPSPVARSILVYNTCLALAREEDH